MRRVAIPPPLAAVLLAIVLFLLSGLLPNGFGSNPDIAVAQATNIIRLAVFLGVVAAGQTLIIISGGEGIDLSAGAVVTLAAIVAYSVAAGQNANVLPALLAALVVGALVGLLNGLGVMYLTVAPLVMTLGMAGLAGFLVVGNTGVVHIRIGDPFLFPSIAAVAVGGTLLAGGKGSYWGTMAGALVLTLITSLLTTMQMPESVRRMVLGATLLIMISIYGRQRGLRQ